MNICPICATRGIVTPRHFPETKMKQSTHTIITFFFDTVNDTSAMCSKARSFTCKFLLAPRYTSSNKVLRVIRFCDPSYDQRIYERRPVLGTTMVCGTISYTEGISILWRECPVWNGCVPDDKRKRTLNTKLETNSDVRPHTGNRLPKNEPINTALIIILMTALHFKSTTKAAWARIPELTLACSQLTDRPGVVSMGLVHTKGHVGDCQKYPTTIFLFQKNIWKKMYKETIFSCSSGKCTEHKTTCLPKSFPVKGVDLEGGGGSSPKRNDNTERFSTSECCKASLNTTKNLLR